MLTAGHVITALNAPVIQPGQRDGGVIPGDQVGVPGRRFIGNLPLFVLPGFPGLFFFVDAGLVPVKKVRLNLPIVHIGTPKNALAFPVRGSRAERHAQADLGGASRDPESRYTRRVNATSARRTHLSFDQRLNRPRLKIKYCFIRAQNTNTTNRIPQADFNFFDIRK